eukprot:m.5275 g.5275  ORF g.5275 m.5275 type:complete len:651 (-) comp4884_c1_seq1:345-2297(-)
MNLVMSSSPSTMHRSRSMPYISHSLSHTKPAADADGKSGMMWRNTTLHPPTTPTAPTAAAPTPTTQPALYTPSAIHAPSQLQTLSRSQSQSQIQPPMSTASTTASTGSSSPMYTTQCTGSCCQPRYATTTPTNPMASAGGLATVREQPKSHSPSQPRANALTSTDAMPPPPPRPASGGASVTANPSSAETAKLSTFASSLPRHMMMHGGKPPLLRQGSLDTLTKPGTIATTDDIEMLYEDLRFRYRPDRQMTAEDTQKPPLSFPCLIGLAMLDADCAHMAVGDLYKRICARFPYFCTAKKGWKNSIRHNLSLNKFFIKVEQPTYTGSDKKSALWGMTPGMASLMKKDIVSCERKFRERAARQRAQSSAVTSSTNANGKRSHAASTTTSRSASPTVSSGRTSGPRSPTPVSKPRRKSHAALSKRSQSAHHLMLPTPSSPAHTQPHAQYMGMGGGLAGAMHPHSHAHTGPMQPSSHMDMRPLLKQSEHTSLMAKPSTTHTMLLPDGPGTPVRARSLANVYSQVASPRFSLEESFNAVSPTHSVQSTTSTITTEEEEAAAAVDDKVMDELFQQLGTGSTALVDCWPQHSARPEWEAPSSLSSDLDELLLPLTVHEDPLMPSGLSDMAACLQDDDLSLTQLMGHPLDNEQLWLS